MIYRDKIIAALENCESEFAFYEKDLREQLASYDQTLQVVCQIDRDEILTRLAATGSPGAIPTEEFFDKADFVIPFDRQFLDREGAREWAYETLLNVTTFAADGSQIMASKDFSLPIAAVQVGWFENPHTTDGSYIKDAAFEIIPPEQVMVRTGGDVEASQQVVHQRRYAAEVQAIKNYLISTAQRRFDPARPPVIFFDSLLVVSFADILPEEQRGFYINQVLSLLNLSKTTGIPVIGFIDTSLARDLVNMLQILEPSLQDSPKLQDAQVLSAKMKWGDRSPIFRCARTGILDHYGDEWRRDIGFFYLKTTADAPPSRIDLPMWIYESGLLDYVVDMVRGEVIVGNGYPYTIEAADQTAVISQQDRELFYALFQEFAERKGLDLRRARKAISKTQRR